MLLIVVWYWSYKWRCTAHCTCYRHDGGKGFCHRGLCPGGDSVLLSFRKHQLSGKICNVYIQSQAHNKVDHFDFCNNTCIPSSELIFQRSHTQRNL